MNTRGFTLVELLIATVVLLAISAAAAALTESMRDAFERTASAGDLGTRSRSALEALVADIRQAGTGLADVAAVVLPHASLDSPGGAAPFTALSVVRVTQHAGGGVLRMPIAAGAATLQLEDAFACGGIDGRCGFAPGDAAAVFDAARMEPIEIADVVETASRLVLSRGVTTSFASGAAVVAVERTTYGVRADSDGMRLVRLTAGGAEQTLVDHVVHLEFSLLGVTAPAVAPAHEGGAPTYGPQPPRMTDDDPRDGWPAGENCTLMIDGGGARASRLAHLGALDALVALDAASLQDGPWCPDAATASRFDADLLRLRAVGIAITVEVASAQLRGPASHLFGHDGTGTRAAQWVPDLALQATVTLRSRR
jgi:prepilin-type N-terminal cleavage/methylation domain-containing protein